MQKNMVSEKFIGIDELASQIKPGDLLVFGYVHSGYEGVFEKLGKFKKMAEVDVFILSILRYREKDIFNLSNVAKKFPGRFIICQSSPEFANVFKKSELDILPLVFFQAPDYLERESESRRLYLFCEVSEPDGKGFCNTGYSAPFPLSVYNKCEIIGLVNKKILPTYGDTSIHEKFFKYFVRIPIEKLPLYPAPHETEVMKKIGRYVAELIENESTFEVGVGAVISSVLDALSNKRDLILLGGFLPEEAKKLVERGTIDKCVANVTGAYTLKFYDWLKMNPSVEIRTMEYTHNLLFLAQQTKFISVLSALYIDLLGQVVSETIGPTQITGAGGSLGFARASQMSEEGKSIIAMTSTYGRDERTKIVPSLDSGSVVTLTRYDVDYVVTEYGIAKLRYKSRKEKAINLINIAHPRHREWLKKEAKNLDLI